MARHLGHAAGRRRGCRAPGTAVAGALKPRDEAIAASPRVPVENAAITGSINLRGARIDDVELNRYHVTVDPTSPKVTLLSPSDSTAGYVAEVGYAVPAGSNVIVPKADTLWTAPEGAKLTPTTPVVLTFDNGAGLLFRRTISIDDDYMFTIADEVVNSGTAPVALFPYGFVQRHTLPASAATYVLHEGMIGVYGEAGLNEVQYGTLKDDGEFKPKSATDGWVGMTDKYWAAVLVPDKAEAFQPRYLYTARNGTETYQADYLGGALDVAPGATATNSTLLFAGAKEVAKIDAYAEQHQIRNFDRLIDWGWFYWLTKPMFGLIDFLFKLAGNFGVAILLVTVIVK
ncbi:membrane protein insertase YidC, partial [Methylobrevis pamukkalensis]|uniref:membrane protein insertase YidC n=1 Tax=Methylobrevis pamukkalensis TaxID=1439726 RepID=UPI001470BF37